jgi:hypothetical protein
LATAASAVVTIGGAGYNSGPAPGNVGQYEGIFDNGFTGIPVTSNMFITAAHVMPGLSSTFIYDNGGTTPTTYTVQPVATLDDLALWEISPNQSADFSLTAPIYTGSSEASSTIYVTGRGYQRGAAIPGGWAYGGGQGPLSWGDNTVSSIDTDTQLGTVGSLGGDFLQFDFNSSSSDPNECMLTPFDSGGGDFIEVNGQYELAGINSFTGARIPAAGVDYAYSVTDSTGMNPIGGTLDNTNGYYYNYFGAPTQITSNIPESSFATRISSRQNFIGEVDGTISAATAAALPIASDGMFVAYSNMTVGAITGTPTVEVGASGSPAKLQIAANSGTSYLGGLSIASGSSLDIANNEVYINGGANNSTQSWLLNCLASGFNGGLWNGPGIDSSLAGASNMTYGVAFADSNSNIVTGLANGQAELVCALYGDCNLDGVVNGEDFLIMASYFGKAAPQGWEDGDFNYGSIVNAEDFTLFSHNVGQSSSGTWAALNAFAAANDFSIGSTPEDSVPEPASLLLLAASMPMLAGRRRSAISRAT